MRRLEGIGHEEKQIMTQYDEIINHPHYEPKHHPRMSRETRAAQFAPYAALHGHAQAIKRTAKFAEYRSWRIIETNPDETGEVPKCRILGLEDN